jgi:hypothetical protein
MDYFSRFTGFQLSSFFCVIRRASLAFHRLSQRHVGLAACNVATRRSAAALFRIPKMHTSLRVGRAHRASFQLGKNSLQGGLNDAGHEI